MDEAAWQSRQLLEIESLSAIYFEESWIRHKAFEVKYLTGIWMDDTITYMIYDDELSNISGDMAGI